MVSIPITVLCILYHADYYFSIIIKYIHSDSRTERLAADVPENHYSAQFFLESRGERDFSWKFVVGKDLKTITTVSVT